MNAYNSVDAAHAAEIWFQNCVARGHHGGKYSEFMVITPERAKVMLRNNPHNRNLKPVLVKGWSDSLRRGTFEVNGESIIVAITGELNDGQHRLTAIVETGISLEVSMVFGVTRKSRLTVDTGTGKTGSQFMTMEDLPNGAALFSTAKFLINLRNPEKGLERRQMQDVCRIELQNSPQLTKSLGKPQVAGGAFRVSGSLMMALHYRFAGFDRTKADDFFSKLADGAGMEETNHPILRLRQRLHVFALKPAKMKLQKPAALTILAWNAFSASRNMRSLKWRDDEATAAEPFPEIRA